MIDYIGKNKVNYRSNKTKIASAEDVYKELQEIGTKKQEHFTVCYLDGSNHVIENRVITIGTLNQSLVHPREVFAPAIELRSASIIIAHNHPSGILEPSYEDLEVTKRLEEAGKLLGIEVLDHLIITNDGFISITKEQIIKEFENVNGINEAKVIFKKLAKKLHPDVGGSNEAFKLLNSVYNDILQNKIYFSNESKFDIELEKIISQILHYEDITIEVVGSWIWLSGNTRAIKERLKELGFKWASKKDVVLWRDEI